MKKTKFDTIIERVLNTMDRNGNPVIYTIPDDYGNYIEPILSFLEKDTMLLTRLREINNDPNATHDQIVVFWNQVIDKANQTGQLQDTPKAVWQELRDYAFSRLSGFEDLENAHEPAWDGGPATVDVFDDNMKDKPASARLAFNAWMKKNMAKGIGKNLMFSKQKLAADAAKTQANPQGGQIQGLGQPA